LFAALEDIDTVVHELDEMKAGATIQMELFRTTGQVSVPSVWVNGRHVGGSEDVLAAARSGQLEKMLGV